MVYKTSATTHKGFMEVCSDKSVSYCSSCEGCVCGVEALVHGEVCGGQAVDNLPTRPVGWLFSGCYTDGRLPAIEIRLAIIRLQTERKNLACSTTTGPVNNRAKLKLSISSFHTPISFSCAHNSKLLQNESINVQTTNNKH